MDAIDAMGAIGSGGAATDEDEEDGADGGGEEEESMCDAERDEGLEEATEATTALTRHRMRCSNMRRLTLADVEAITIHHVESSSILIPRREAWAEGELIV